MTMTPGVRKLALTAHVTTSRLATAAAEVVLSSADLGRLRMQLTADAAAALLALLVATTLAIYKPRGMTRYGARKEDQRTSGAPRWAKLLVAAIVLVLVALRLLTHPGGHSPSGG